MPRARAALIACLLPLACARAEVRDPQPCVEAAAPAPEQTAESEPEPDGGEPEAAQPEEIGEACNEEVHRRFDFWLGRWVVHTEDGKLAGHNHIERAHAGCAVLEHWRSAKGGGGTSTNYYDPEKKKWVQNWIDARGSVIQLEGDLRGDEMVLEGRYVKADGTVEKMRGVWTPLDDGRVRQRFETSRDGESWQLWFEGFYTRE
jgi:hypothetical protein